MVVRLIAPETPDFVHHDQYLEWWGKLSDEQKIAARIKCENDFGWFVHNHGWLLAKPDSEMSEEALATATRKTGYQPRAGWVQFRLWPAQRRAIDKLMLHWLVLVLKVRQFGATWIAAHRAQHSSTAQPVSVNEALPNSVVARMRSREPLLSPRRFVPHMSG